MFLLSIHGDLQLGKYSVYNTLCLQLTLLINCNRNTAISSLIAGRIQLYISSLSRIQKLWLPDFQRRRGGGEKVFYLRITETTLKIDSLKAAFWKGLRRVASVVALLSLFAELLFLKTSQEVFVVEQCRKASLFASFLFFHPPPPTFFPFFSTLFSFLPSLPLSLSPISKKRTLIYLMKRVLLNSNSEVGWVGES